RDLTTGSVSTFDGYNPGFRGGVRVATGNFTGGASPDIVVAPGAGGGPNVRIFNGDTGAVIADFFAYDPSFSGGLYVAVGDINGDGVPDVITGADAGGGPHVQVFDGAALASGTGVKLLASFFAYNVDFHGGVRVASADVNRD